MGGNGSRSVPTMLRMDNTESAGTRAYQRLLIDEANAEMGRQRISRRKLSRITGIPRTTMDRLFQCERDMNVAQWEAIATALGFDPGELAGRAHGVLPPRSDNPEPPLGTDVRTTIQWLLANPTYDPELNHRLSEADHQVDLSGQQKARLLDTIKEVRREELNRALAALPPSEKQGGNNGSSGMSA